MNKIVLLLLAGLCFIFNFGLILMGDVTLVDLTGLQKLSVFVSYLGWFFFGAATSLSFKSRDF